MLIKAFVDDALGNSSYLIASETTGRAVLIDPERDIDRYVQVAEGLGLKLEYAVETHLHADFVSGLRELAEHHGVTIGASAEAQLAFAHVPLCEGDVVDLGDCALHVLATPGHTPEHISFALTEATHPVPAGIFTGGALIVGGAARPDLLGHHFTRPLTHLLYETIHHKLLGYPDDVAVYPTHGAGSFCNVASSSERTSTIGRERKSNPLALAQTEEEFAAQALGALPSYPTYFHYGRALNQLGARVLHSVPILPPLSPHAVREQMAQRVVVVDVRTPREFAAGHIQNAYGIPLAVSLSTWAGWVVPFAAPIILIADDPMVREQAVRELIRIGYDDLRGYLEGGMSAWAAEGLPVVPVPVISVEELQDSRARGDKMSVLDVRQDAEWRAGHLPSALHTEVGRLRQELPPLSKDERAAVHCRQSYRATVAISLLQQHGFTQLSLLYGGYDAWEAAGYPVARETQAGLASHE